MCYINKIDFSFATVSVLKLEFSSCLEFQKLEFTTTATYE